MTKPAPGLVGTRALRVTGAVALLWWTGGCSKLLDLESDSRVRSDAGACGAGVDCSVPERDAGGVRASPEQNGSAVQDTLDSGAQAVSPCASMTCDSGARCVESGNGTASCECLDGYMREEGVCVLAIKCGAELAGSACTCADDPCLNGGRCAGAIVGVACDCTGTGFSGDRCQLNEDDCQGDPCLNGGRCTDEIADFACDCTGTDFSGDRCEVPDAPNCPPDFCEHGGCETTGNGFTCNCAGTGFYGDRCEFNVNDCVPNPCENGGSCGDRIGGYVCSCLGTGFIGVHCEIREDDCSPDPCANGGRCHDQGRSYECDCSGTGYQGPQCEDDENECAMGTDECAASERCENTLGAYECI